MVEPFFHTGWRSVAASSPGQAWDGSVALADHYLGAAPGHVVISISCGRFCMGSPFRIDATVRP